MRLFQTRSDGFSHRWRSAACSLVVERRLSSTKRSADAASSRRMHPDDVADLFPVVHRPTLHFSKYVSPNWSDACRVAERVWWEVRRDHRRGVAVLEDADDCTTTSETSTRSGGVFDDPYRQQHAVLQLLVTRCFFPPISKLNRRGGTASRSSGWSDGASSSVQSIVPSTSCQAWRSSLLLFHAAVMHRDAENTRLLSSHGQRSNGGSDLNEADARRRLCADVLSEFYSDTAAAHLVRNATMSHGALWQEVLELYHAVRDAMGSSCSDGSSASSSHPSFRERRAQKMQHGACIPFNDASYGHGRSDGVAARHNLFQAVERPIRLMTMTALLDGGQWMHGVLFFQHMLRHRDYPNHIVTGYLFKELSNATGGGRWHETLQLLHIATQLLSSGNVAILDGRRGAPQKPEGIGGGREDAWAATLCAGLASVCRFVKQGVVPRSVLDACLVRVREACPTFRPDGSLSFAMAQLPSVHRVHQQVRPRHEAHEAATLGSETTDDVAGSASHTVALGGDVFAAIRGAALDRNWRFGLQLLRENLISIGAHRSRIPAIGTGGDAMAKGATLRQFLLGAAAPSTCEALHIRHCLDQLLPMPGLSVGPPDHVLGPEGFALAKEIAHEKEIVLSKLGARHSGLGCWLEALDVLLMSPQIRNERFPSTLTDALMRATTPRSVSFFLRIAMPWEIALMTLKYFRPVLVLGDVAGASSAAAVPSEGAPVLVSPVSAPPSPYTSAMLNVCESLVRQRAQADTLTNMLTTLMAKYRTSPTSLLLVHAPQDTMRELLRAHGEVVDHGVLYRAIAAPVGSPDRIATWEGCMTVLTACIRRQVRSVPERSDTSVFSVLSTACVLAALERLRGGTPLGRDRPSSHYRGRSHERTPSATPPSRSTSDAAELGTQWQMTLQLWKWIVNAQPRCVQKANHDVHQLACTQLLTSLAVRTAAVTLDAADALGTNEVGVYGAQVLWDILVRHKLRPPLHALSPALLEEILPAHVFRDTRNQSAAAAEARLQCTGVLVHCIVGRCHAGRFAPAERAEALYQAVKYASRGARYALVIERQSGNVCNDVVVGATVDADGSPLWCVALAAATSAEILVGLRHCRPQLLAHALDAIPSSAPLLTRDALIEALLRCYGGVAGLLLLTEAPNAEGAAVDPKALLSERAVQLLLRKGSWQRTLTLAAHFQPAATVEALQSIAPDAAFNVLQHLEQHESA